MLKVSLFEFIIRGIPESLIFFIAAYVFTKNTIKVKKYLFISVIYALLVYMIRLLPINNGVDFIINLIIFIALNVIINKFDIIGAIKAGIGIMLIGFISEGVNALVIQFILKKDLNYILSDPVRKTIYFMPSLLIEGCIILAYCSLLLKRKELK